MRKMTGVLALIVGMAQMMFGTTLVRMDLDDLTSQSHAIVDGKIAASRTEWNANHSMIFTVYTVNAISYLKGQLGSSFEIREPGGERDGLSMKVASVPVFSAGEEAVLFVWTDTNGNNQVIGFEQGALQVRTDARTGAKTVNRAMRLGSARSASAAAASAPSTSTSLTKLFDQIRSSAAAAAKASATSVRPQ